MHFWLKKIQKNSVQPNWATGQVYSFKIALKNVNKEVSDTMCLDETPINDDAETEIQYPKCEGYGVRID